MTRSACLGRPLFALLLSCGAAGGWLLAGGTATLHAESCTTQSAMAPAERDRLAAAARDLALKIQANDSPALRPLADTNLANDFGALQYLVATTAPRLAGDTVAVQQVYLLDATNLKPAADGASGDAQFLCNLNGTANEAEFDIHSLPAGRYAFAMVEMTPVGTNTAPWRISFLLRQQNPAQPQSAWLLTGVYPKPTTAAGHDGLWFWQQARQAVRDKQPWNAWLYYQTAIRLLRPAEFVQSTHLEKLQSEAAAATPPALSAGVSADAPLVIAGVAGAEYRFTSLALDDSQAPAGLDVAAHLRADPLGDQAARARNLAAAAALLAAQPELRKAFHGVEISAETPGQLAVTSEFAMADVR